VFFFDVYRSLFFFQAEDGIRDRNVTGVQTCALPIYGHVVAGQPSTPHERRDAGTSGAWGGTRGTRGPLPCAPAVHGGDGRPCGGLRHQGGEVSVGRRAMPLPGECKTPSACSWSSVVAGPTGAPGPADDEQRRRKSLCAKPTRCPNSKGNWNSWSRRPSRS